MTEGLSKKQLYELLKTLIATHDSVSMETDSFSHGQGASINLYLNEACVTRDYWNAPKEYNDLTFIFFEYFQETYEEGFESDHSISFHLDDKGEIFGKRVDYASTNYFGDELSIDPLVSSFQCYDPSELEGFSDLTDDEVSTFLKYRLEFTVSHSSQSDLMMGFIVRKGRKKSPATMPFKLHQCVNKIQETIDDCAQHSFEILRATYSQYEQSWQLSGDIYELYRDEYALSVYKSVTTLDLKFLFEVE
jgi:hypothetical protein